MNKKILYLILFILFNLSIYSNDLFENLNNGEYACYYDFRQKNPYYVQYLYLKKFGESENVLWVRSINLNKYNGKKLGVGDHIMYQVFLIEKAGIIDIKGHKVLDYGLDDSPETYQHVIDFLNQINFYKKRMNKNDGEYEDYWPEYKRTYLHKLNKYLPLSRLESTRLKDNNSKLYFIDRGGIFKKNEDLNKFYDFLPVAKNIINARKIDYKIPQVNLFEVKLNDFSFNLDGNWSKTDDSNTASYILKINNETLARTSIEKLGSLNDINSKYIELSNFARYYILTENSYKMLHSLNIEEKEDGILIRYLLVENDLLFQGQKRFEVRGNDLYIHSFLVNEQILRNNIIYFENLSKNKNLKFFK